MVIVLGVDTVAPTAETLTLPAMDWIVAALPIVAVEMSWSSVIATAIWMPARVAAPTRPDEAWDSVVAVVAALELMVTSPAAVMVLDPVMEVVTLLSALA